MRNQTIQYYLKKDGGKKQYTPTNTEMDILMEDIEGTLQYMLGNACRIHSIQKNIVKFVCEDTVFDKYGHDVFLHPDDDGNYYVTRKDTNGKTIHFGWYATLVQTEPRASNTRRNTRKFDRC
jgi:hypothetical protein